MDKLKYSADNVVCIRDLKQLGREGGAFAYLETGELIKLEPKYGIAKKRGYIRGVAVELRLKFEYKKVYDAIKRIDRNGILIARRQRFGSSTRLTLTGKGYHRKKPYDKMKY
ncbi:hypothetical protein [Streptococcus sp. zg-JUN1979]|uniref:hypothetical protein n=1 Tax=Streptococcus sp. zg-JUN1979 TaxID=3391450 RepID=UPI0039A53643